MNDNGVYHIYPGLYHQTNQISFPIVLGMIEQSNQLKLNTRATVLNVLMDPKQFVHTSYVCRVQYPYSVFWGTDRYFTSVALRDAKQKSRKIKFFELTNFCENPNFPKTLISKIKFQKLVFQNYGFQKP